MHIGVPREIKNHEYRVGLTPSSVREMVEHGHQVTVESGAGTGIGATDEVYRKAGAVIADTARSLSTAQSAARQLAQEIEHANNALVNLVFAGK